MHYSVAVATSVCRGPKWWEGLVVRRRGCGSVQEVSGGRGLPYVGGAAASQHVRLFAVLFAGREQSHTGHPLRKLLYAQSCYTRKGLTRNGPRTDQKPGKLYILLVRILRFG